MEYFVDISISPSVVVEYVNASMLECLDNDLVNTSSEIITPQFECLPYSSANPYDGIFVINQCPDRNSSSETDFQWVCSD
jgi:hypothetical protein